MQAEHPEFINTKTRSVCQQADVTDHFCFLYFFFFKQKTAYGLYQCDWSSDVCSSDLQRLKAIQPH